MAFEDEGFLAFEDEPLKTGLLEMMRFFWPLKTGLLKMRFFWTLKMWFLWPLKMTKFLSCLKMKFSEITEMYELKAQGNKYILKNRSN